MISLSKIKRGIGDFSQPVEEKPTEVIDPDSESLSRILPDELYKKVAKIIGFDENVQEKMSAAKRKSYKRIYKGLRNISRAIQTVAVERDLSEEYYTGSSVEPPTPRGKTRDLESDPYHDFFKKTEREQVRWTSKYLPPETEMEKGLVRRADDLTNKICSDFCIYMQNLGGYDSPLFKEETVKQLFQIEFNAHVAKSLKICPVKMKSVPEQVAKTANYQKAFHKEVFKRQLKNDIVAERRPKNKVAFGNNLSKNDQWIPPRNNTNKRWLNIDNLPKKAITMENVWGDITSLKSVQDFCQWIIDYPELSHPAYLKSHGMLDKAKLNKIKDVHKYDKTNKLPKINIKKQLSTEAKRKFSLPPENIKISN